MTRAGALALGVALLIVCAACGGSSSKALQPKDLSKLVLQLPDLRGPYSVIEDGRGARFEVPPGQASRARTDGWVARYRAPGTAHVPLLVQSRVDVYPNEADARKQLADYAASFNETNGNGGGPTAVPAIADGAQAFSLEQGVAPNLTHFFGIAWRHRNLVGFVQTEGVGQTATLAGTVRLARAQDGRITAAS
jgi:hypothetical protein